MSITENSIDAYVGMFDFVMQTMPGTVTGTPIKVFFPHHQNSGHANTDSESYMNFDMERVGLSSSRLDNTSALGTGLYLYGVWNSHVRDVSVQCKLGPITPGQGGFKFAEVFNLVFDDTEAYNCDTGYEDTDYSEGVVLERALVPGSNIAVRVDTNANQVNGYNMDVLTISHSELVGYSSAISANGVFQMDVHDSHMILATDASTPPTSTACPTANIAGQSVVVLTGNYSTLFHDNHIDGQVTTLNNGLACTFVADGVRFGPGTVNSEGHDNVFQNLGASIDFEPNSGSNTMLNLRTITASSTGAAYVDNGSANVLTYTDGAAPRSLH